MMADIFDMEVIVPESYESSCLGACILGLYATGKIDSFDVVSDMIGSTNTSHTSRICCRRIREAITDIH